MGSFLGIYVAAYSVRTVFLKKGAAISPKANELTANLTATPAIIAEQGRTIEETERRRNRP